MSRVRGRFTPALGLELVFVCLLAAIAAASIPLYAGEWSWSWDALNHHVYLGYIAETPRWDLDVVAASVQSYQYPYLYWPIYRLSLLSSSGAVIGAIWSAFLAVMLTVPLWLASLNLLRSEAGGLQAAFERIAACALGLSSVVVLAAINTTSNDPLAGLPVLWAVALMTVTSPSNRRAALASGLCGVAVAFKLSNGLYLPLLLLWCWVPVGGRWSVWALQVARRGSMLALGVIAGFVVAYLPWGWQLWRHTGNPFYPLLGGVFGS